MDDQSNPEKPTIWKEARNHIEQGNYDKAIEIYKYLLIRFSENSIVVELANSNLADIYLTLNRTDLAETHINKALKRNPEKAEYRYLLGFVYSRQALWPDAAREFEKAIEKEPDNAEYLRGMGWANVNAGDKSRGMEFLKRAKELEPLNINVLLDLANSYLFDMNFEQAKRYAQEAVNTDPTNAPAKKVLERICQFQRDFGKGAG